MTTASTAPRFDKAAIMRQAWAAARLAHRAMVADGFQSTLRGEFAYALKAAWLDAKRRVGRAQAIPTNPVVDRIRAIESSRDFLTAADRTEIEALRFGRAA